MDFVGNTITLLVDSGATEQFLDSNLISGFKTVIFGFNALDMPNEIVATGGQVLLGTHKGVLVGTVTDEDEGDHTVRLPCLLVPGLARHVLSSTNASRRAS